VSRLFPALDIHWAARADDDAAGGLLAALDDSRPTALEERPEGLRVFFASALDRDHGCTAVLVWNPSVDVRAVDVPDEDWAARSQAGLRAVHVGHLHIAPPWDPITAANRTTGGSPTDRVIVIQPSMGFGTGHHATTRLCLDLLQQGEAAGRSMLDIGTGSGVLALAAWGLGAAPVVAIDLDADALTSAQENLDLNGATDAIKLLRLDFTDAASNVDGPFDIVTANLTGAMIEQTARRLASLVAPGGRLIAGGFQGDEEASVTAALRAAGFTLTGRREEDEWIGIEGSTRSKFEV